MRKALLCILFPLAICAQNDSLNYLRKTDSIYQKVVHVYILAGGSISNYYSAGIRTSSAPVGYRFGFGIANQVRDRYEVGFSVFYQESQFNDVSTNVWDSYFGETVSLNTSMKFQQIYFGGELLRTRNKFQYGANAGIHYLIRAKTMQNVYSSATDSIKAINIYNTYTIYEFQHDSYQNGITPFAGISLCYYPLNWLGIKYQCNIDILPTPYNRYAFFKNINPVLNCLTLNIKIK